MGTTRELGELQRPAGRRRLERRRQGRPRRLPDRPDRRPVAAAAWQRDDFVRVGPTGRPAARRQLRWRPQGRGRCPPAREAPASSFARQRGHGSRSPPAGSTDMPLTGDWDGNGRSDLGLYRPSTHQSPALQFSGTLEGRHLGRSGQQPVTGDWNKDGRTDVGTFNVTNGYLDPARADATASTRPSASSTAGRATAGHRRLQRRPDRRRRRLAAVQRHVLPAAPQGRRWVRQQAVPFGLRR